MREPAADLARRSPDALDKIVGTGDTRAMLAELERNVRDVIDIARDRGFVTRFNNRDFFGFPAWSLLALTYGLVPFVAWTRMVENGWEARAIVRTREGSVVASAEAMCTRKESSRRSADDHTLRAMAQTRAMRNALRSCLGAALVMAGFDFADPEAPATNEQVGMLHQLERELGMPHDEGHALANVASYKELNREDASTLIDRWTAMRDEIQGGAAMEPTPAASNPRPGTSQGGGTATSPTSDTAGATDPHPDTSAALGEVAADEGSPGGAEGEAVTHPGDSSPPVSATAPASSEAWERAQRAGVTAAKALVIAKKLGYDVTSAAAVTGEQLAKVVAKVKDSA